MHRGERTVRVACALDKAVHIAVKADLLAVEIACIVEKAAVDDIKRQKEQAAVRAHRPTVSQNLSFFCPSSCGCRAVPDRSMVSSFLCQSGRKLVCSSIARTLRRKKGLTTLCRTGMLEKKGGSCHAVPVQRPAGAHEIYYPLEPDALHPAESLSEHTCDTALLAHMLCLIARRYTGTPCRPKTVAVAALYHDAPEIITGDMPTPVKYSSPTLRDAYKALETESVRCMTGLLPDELSEELSPFISGELLTAEEKRLLKAADRLSASSNARRSSAAATTSLTRRWPSRKRPCRPCTARKPTGS